MRDTRDWWFLERGLIRGARPWPGPRVKRQHLAPPHFAHAGLRRRGEFARVRRSGLRPRSRGAELIENAIFAISGRAARISPDSCAKAASGFALDDFGTGYFQPDLLNEPRGLEQGEDRQILHQGRFYLIAFRRRSSSSIAGLSRFRWEFARDGTRRGGDAEQHRDPALIPAAIPSGISASRTRVCADDIHRADSPIPAAWRSCLPVQTPPISCPDARMPRARH